MTGTPGREADLRVVRATSVPEQFLQLEDRGDDLRALRGQPLPPHQHHGHHRLGPAAAGARLHLMQRYSTAYWKALVGVAAGWLPPAPPAAAGAGSDERAP